MVKGEWYKLAKVFLKLYYKCSAFSLSVELHKQKEIFSEFITNRNRCAVSRFPLKFAVINSLKIFKRNCTTIVIINKLIKRFPKISYLFIKVYTHWTLEINFYLSFQRYEWSILNTLSVFVCGYLNWLWAIKYSI